MTKRYSARLKRVSWSMTRIPFLPRPAALCAIALLMLAAGPGRLSAADPVNVDSVAALARELRRIEFLIPDHHLARLDAIPRTRIAGPGALSAWREKVPFRNSVFIRMALSAVLQVNEALVATRARVQSLTIARAGPADLSWLSHLIADYGVATADEPPTEALKMSLLRRLDTLPPSLLIAKGALDSGWLPSRYTQPEGPAFGRWTLGRVTAAGADGAGFRQPRAALEAYMHHLNTHPDFVAMRDARVALRAEERSLDGHALAAYLAPALGRLATQKLQRVIRRNTLKRTDRARLAAGPVFVFQRAEKR